MPPDGGGGADQSEMDSGRKTGIRAEPRKRGGFFFLFSINGSFNKISIHTSNKRQTSGENAIPMTDMSAT